MAKMVRRTCAFCSEGAAGSVMYIAKERDIAAHQDCLLFSSGFVESEEYNPENLDIRFDVASVLKELKRGKRLVCNFCRKKGATVGCEERACRRSYHYFCALCDDAAIETDQVKGVYRVFCPKHDPSNRTSHYGAANKKRRYTLTSPAITEEMKTEEKAEENHLQILKRKNNRHKVQIDLVRKCKQAGLLDDIFEEMLDTLHLAQEKLMDDNTSETEYEETVMALFDCGLFENILTNIHSGIQSSLAALLQTCLHVKPSIRDMLPPQQQFHISRKMEATERSRNAVRQSFANKVDDKVCKHCFVLSLMHQSGSFFQHVVQLFMKSPGIQSGTEEKIQELLENRKRLDHKIELLQDLKEVIPTPESTASTSSTVSE